MYPKSRIVRMVVLLFMLAVYCAQVAPPAQAQAPNVIISWPDMGKDWAYDSQRNLVYLVGNAKIRRYDLSSQAFLEPFPIFAYVSAAEISPDNSKLVVGLLNMLSQPSGLLIIDLDTNTWQQVAYPETDQDMGTYSMAFVSDTTLLISSSGTQGYSAPVRSYDLTTQTFTPLESVLNGTVLVASADRQKVMLVEPNKGLKQDSLNK